MKKYHIERNIDGHPISFGDQPLTKKEILIILNDSLYLGKRVKKLEEAICCYSREKITDIDFSSDKQAIDSMMRYCDSSSIE